MVVKVGLGALGVGVCCVGGIAIFKPNLLGISDQPKFHTLAEDNGFTTTNDQTTNTHTNYKDKFGDAHKDKLVGVTNKQGSESTTNEAWWNWSFERWKKDKPSSGKFKYSENSGTISSITKGYDNTDNKALNKVCDEAYKKAESELKGDTEANIADTEFKKSDVWKYCSSLGKEPPAKNQ